MNNELIRFSAPSVDLFDGDYTEAIEKGPEIKGRRIILSEFGRKAELLDKKRKANPIVPGAADYIQGILYDRYTAAASTTLAPQFQWFTNPIGQAGKTKADTNMTLVQQLPAPQWMNAVSLSLYFTSNMIKEDIDNFINAYWIEFWVQSKIYSEGPPIMYPCPGGMQATWTFATATSRSVVTNGVPTSTNFFDLRLPGGLNLGGVPTDGATGVLINAGQNFHVDAKSAAGISLAAIQGTYGGFNVMAIFQGIQSREVQ